MKLNEWKDSNGNKITSGPVVSNQTSSGSSNTGYKKRFEKLLDYHIKHRSKTVDEFKVIFVSEDSFHYREHHTSPKDATIEVVAYIGELTEAWRLQIFGDGNKLDDLSGTDWVNLIKELRAYLNLPTTGTPEYKNLLTEWLDKTGKKVSLNPPAVKTSSGSTKTNKEKFTSLLYYMKKNKSITTDNAEAVRLDDSGFTYKEHRKSATGKDFTLTLLVGFGRGPYYDHWEYELYKDEKLLEKNSGTGFESFLWNISAYFNTPKVGSPEHQKLCEWVDSKGNKVSTTSSTASSQPASTFRPLNTVYYEGGSVAKKVRENAQRIIVTSKVSEIYATTFYDCKKLQEVILPETIKRIGNFAFSHCVSLVKINLPSSISYIATEAFYECGNLTIYCDQGSYADTFAADHNIPVVYNTSTIAEDFKEYENLWD